ncbi:hypothetical protein [Corynebacterium deserti]|uniref:hypothetical protein n=1 Tax=Corynebacterium deserti TaxID=1408191 RepID=UPI001E28945E|nr:hypothetical protein [Corynebacterium deserti]
MKPTVDIGNHRYDEATTSPLIRIGDITAMATPLDTTSAPDPVVVIAAAHLHERGLPFRVVEQGPQAGAAIAQWGHTRLFSPWEYNIDTAARRLLERHDWSAPQDEVLPTGHELSAEYLAPGGNSGDRPGDQLRHPGGGHLPTGHGQDPHREPGNHPVHRPRRARRWHGRGYSGRGSHRLLWHLVDPQPAGPGRPDSPRGV